MTYRQLLTQLEQLKPEQRQQEIRLIPDRYNTNHMRSIDWFDENGSAPVELRVAAEDVVSWTVLNERNELIFVSIAVGEYGTPLSMFSDEMMVEGNCIPPSFVNVGKGMPYLRMANKSSDYERRER